MCDEDQFLLDLWDQGLDCDVTSISSLMKSQGKYLLYFQIQQSQQPNQAQKL